VPSTLAEDYDQSTIANYAVDSSDTDFDGMSMMPISCVNYMDGHMIKFDIFESEYNFQCHANSAGSYVVSISNFMRHYFNYQSLIHGSDFTLPSDVGYLNCVKLEQTTESGQKLYARIGCLERETFASNRLSLHLYTNNKCSQPFDDGQTNEKHSTIGYNIDGEYFETQVSFHPSFFSCESCKPQSIVDGFSKQESSWFDDDGMAKDKYFDDWVDDVVHNDDAYGTVQQYTNNEVTTAKEDDDNFYTANDDDDGLRRLSVRKFTPAKGGLEKFEREFWRGQRELSYYVNNTNDDVIENSVGDWNMCTKMNKYSIWCDQDCQSLGNLIHEWSSTDLILLGIMCTFLVSTMGFVLSNRSQAYAKAAIYADDYNSPNFGIPPRAMGYLFLMLLVSIAIFAGLRLVNETLVIALVCCFIVLGYLVKITFFKGNKPAGTDDERQHTHYHAQADEA